MSTPLGGGAPLVKLSIDLPDTDLPDPSKSVRKADYKAMLNGGYIVRFEIEDPNSSMLNAMIENGYFEKVRTQPVAMTYQFKQDASSQYPRQATKPEKAYILSIKAWGKCADVNFLEFIGIDPPSWWLNMGDAAGEVYKGRISDVITQVVNKYAPGIQPIVSTTTDSNQNQWWQYRQDPKTFLGSLIDYSTAFTRSKTSWIVVPDNETSIRFQEQADIPSVQRAYYKHTEKADPVDTLVNWSFLADNALSLSNTKIITSGLSAISGEYLDKITDQPQQQVYVRDETTTSKYVAQTDQTQAYAKPPGGPPPGSQVAGWTSIGAIPEIYSAGDSGKPYTQYIDGKARNLYLNMVNMLFRAQFQVVGHGEWTGCDGLGTDTIYVRWHQSEGSDKPYFLNGNWLVYGYEHHLTLKRWWTDIYCARFDYNADAHMVGGGG